ncbi:Asp-tRNA(Asn)/Glu-tRNA(Gln) amidotransferase subunit GatC [Legionella fallonii]|uniref:Aspartyl/glutamyl-tRNA(Asn/Gln) amidotransferase subunit C n=1 Tax=Legionella fallonii LLAP-10 TaxID=1212491 RepID=A0A098G3W5_9GAMM|nr:Asp-tRNA(Asn)/Glu-tRNA(Gln) amidotransferase subunit GatC [Legionella fallonii]CEG57168.1 Aspartyl/glutamyl-tRNA(Asn/Gln) amidotransferase subunit C [Legionella fallonii LLAP-10]
MTISQKDLEKIARLAYLDTESSTTSQLTQDVSAIMDFVEQLRSADTHDVAPLFHPFALHQRLRIDAVTEEECIRELEEMAPLFDDDLYLVPKVIESDK